MIQTRTSPQNVGKCWEQFQNVLNLLTLSPSVLRESEHLTGVLDEDQFDALQLANNNFTRCCQILGCGIWQKRAARTERRAVVAHAVGPVAELQRDAERHGRVHDLHRGLIF